jgi:hypothetical protein
VLLLMEGRSSSRFAVLTFARLVCRFGLRRCVVWVLAPSFYVRGLRCVVCKEVQHCVM